MSDATPIASPTPRSATPATPPAPAQPDTSLHVRAASHDDVPALVAAVRELLVELGGTPPPAPAMQAAARALLDDPRSGALLVAQAGEQLVGVLGASWQLALHIPGRYALIQDLWVHPDRRGQAVGGELLAALYALAGDRGIERVEVGLPRERFQGIRATEAFYLHNGFAPLGTRMRRTLP